MQDIEVFLCERKEQYLKRAERLEESEKEIKRMIANNEKAYGGIVGYPKAIIPDENGREQLQSVICKQNELLARVELIEEIQEMYF